MARSKFQTILASTVDLPVLLAFPDSATGGAVIAELARRLRDSESALTAHNERHDDGRLKHDYEAHRDAFERVSARISVALADARKRLANLQQAEQIQ